MFTMKFIMVVMAILILDLQLRVWYQRRWLQKIDKWLNDLEHEQIQNNLSQKEENKMEGQFQIRRNRNLERQPFFEVEKERKERLKRFVDSLDDFFRDIEDEEQQ